jgi:ribosomal protein S12 methylthiotransferase
MEHIAALVHLGCAKNLVDSETVVAQLINMGYTMTSNPAEASLIVVNTCGFLQSAVEEAIDNILELVRYKDAGVCEQLLVIGCLVQRYGKKLLPLLPEVDLFIGTSYYQDLGDILPFQTLPGAQRLWLERPRNLSDSRTLRIRSTPFYSAYLKIAEGCSNRCTFCLIPQLRGPLRSRPVTDVVAEDSQMVADGVLEINLIAQDITAYGRDRHAPMQLVRLLEALDSLQGLAWVRLLYAFPGHITDSLLTTMAHSQKIVPYLDLPVQHCVPRILQAMHRGGPVPDYEKLVEHMRMLLPEVVLRTSIMVGFPGETDADFAELLRFIERVQFDHVGVFRFSPEAGTRAARLPEQVPDTLKQQRYHHLLESQRTISGKRLQRWVGRTLPVLIEGLHPETELLLTGRMSAQAPEVDGMTIITKGVSHPGEIRSVRITAATDYDVIGELVDSRTDPSLPREIP